jgi:hypothetical protein
MNLLIGLCFGAPSHKDVNSFAPQHKKISLANFSFRSSLFSKDEVRPGEQGEPKWPGKPQKSSKCRLAWKSTCMPAPPASKRLRRLHVLTKVDLQV